MILSRLLTGQINLYDSGAEDTEFCKRVELALNNLKWNLQGSPDITFDSKNHVVVAAQSVVGEPEGDYPGFTNMKDTPPASSPGDGHTLYRLLVGKDDAEFCKYVEQKLNEGWKLYGSPSLAFDGTHVIAARAVIREEKGPYRGYVPITRIPPRAQL
jgi:hypothetical protein